MITYGITKGRYGQAALTLLVPGVLVIMLQPWMRPPSLHAFDFQRWVEVVGLTLLTVFFLPYASVILSAKRWLALFLFSFLFLLFLAIWLSKGPAFLSVSVIRMMLYGVVFFGFASAWQECSDQVKTWVAILLVSTLSIYCLYSIIGAFSLLASGVYDRTLAVFGFSNVNHAAGFMMVSFLLLPGLDGLLQEQTRKVAMAARASGVALAFMLAVIGSRGALLACLTAIGLLFFFHREKAVDRYLRWLLEVFAIGLLAYLVFTAFAIGLNVDLWIGGKNLIADSGRFELYEAAWLGALEAPWLGHGPLSYAGLSALTLGHSHNALLTLLYEFGFLITFHVVALGLWCVCIVWKRGAALVKSPVAISGMAALVGFAVHSQFSGLPMIPATMFMALVAGAFITSSVMMPSFPPRSSRWMSPAKPLAVVLALLYLLLVFQYWQAVNLDVSQKPRFWLHGGTEIWYPAKN